MSKLRTQPQPRLRSTMTSARAFRALSLVALGVSVVCSAGSSGCGQTNAEPRGPNEGEPAGESQVYGKSSSGGQRSRPRKTLTALTMARRGGQARFAVGELASEPPPPEDAAFRAASRKAASLPVEKRIVFLAKQGEKLWEESCSRKTAHLLCAGSLPQAFRRGPVKVFVRKRSTALQARHRLRQVVSLWKKHGGGGKLMSAKDGEGKSLAYWVAMARFFLADHMLERFLQMDLFEELDQGDDVSGPSAKSMSKLNTELKQKLGLLLLLRKAYAQVIKTHKEEWKLPALSRLGLVFEELASGLRFAKPPPGLKTEEQKRLYQAQISTYVTKMDKASRKAYRLCVDTARSSSIDDEWSRLCNKRFEAITKSGRRR